MSTDLLANVRSALTEVLDDSHAAVRDAVRALPEDQLWAKPVHPGNSVGHLVLHLTGNLNHFVGAQLGNTGYVRDREREFTEPNPVPKERLLSDLDAAVTTFRRVVGGLSADQLSAPHPEARFGTVAKALVTLVSHFALHRGQISYLTRLLKPPAAR